MGAILSFDPHVAGRKSAKPLPEGAGAIIIFPGVRYERPSAGDKDSLPTKPAAGAAREKGPSNR
jgi:hypothetical protein